jgi:hypothetical protein
LLGVKGNLAEVGGGVGEVTWPMVGVGSREKGLTETGSLQAIIHPRMSAIRNARCLTTDDPTICVLPIFVKRVFVIVASPISYLI